MDAFDFVIPLSLDALQESTSTRQYVVYNISTSKEIPKKIQEAQVAFRQDGPHFILKAQNFDVLYTMSKVTAELALLLDEGDLSAKERHQWLNVLKMTTYIACNLTESFENEYNKPSTDTLLLGKQGRKKSARKSDDGTDWEEERNRMLVQLFSVLQHPLHRLWEPPIMEEDFVNLIANCCYKILESPTMNLARTKPTRDSIFQIIGTLVKKFNHGLACSLKLMQLLQHFEHMVVPCAQGVILLIESFGITSVVAEMVREIAKVDARELMKDTSGLRNFSQFLVEVSEKCPQVMLPSLSLLVNFLHEEASGMRNCVLSILGSIVLKVLSGEELDPKSRDLRDQCLDHLEDHIHDIHAFVRSKVLHIWNDLVSEKAVPLRRQQQVLKLTLGRLKDKSSHVRKSAVQLLTAFLKGNPFAAKLPLEELEGQYEEELKKLKEMDPKAALDLSAEEEDKLQVEKTVTGRELWAAMLPEVVSIVLEVVDEGGTEDDDDDEDSLEEDTSLNDAVLEIAEALNCSKIRRAVKLLECALEMFHGAEVFGYDPEIHSSKAYKKLSKDEELTDHQIRHLKLLVNYLKDSVCFAKLFNKGLPVLCQLLSSKHVSDVLEAVQFFVTAFEFGLLNAMTGVRRMLALVWSKEQAVKDAVIGAYQRLYINIDAPNERTRAQHIVRNLSALITGATLGERTSMEEIIAQFVNSGDITKQCLTLLWERFTKTLPDTTDDESLAGLILLAMCANSEAHIVSSNIGVLVNSGLGERGLRNFTLVKETCTALLKLSTTKPKTDDPNPPNRLDRDHEIFERLAKILLEGLNVLEDRQYSPMAVEAVSLIYSLAEHPDLICGDILQEMCKIMLSSYTEAADSAGDGSQPETEDIKVPVGILTRFFVFVGQVALRQLIHLDTYVFSELKRRNYLKEEMETEKKKKKKKRNTRKSLATSATEASMNRGGSQDGDIDEEMGLTGAVADDMEAEYIRSICETEIINADNLLSLVKPLIWAVCTNPGKYADAELRTASTLALAKFMMISSDLCEDNLQLLFTILEKSEDDVIRANIVIALGDLSFRFPNQLEPWTPRIYARLRDSSPKVRQNTLTILTHLILNDMVKVKGQISDIALCITDDDPRISGLAKLFFSELARKGNALYNVLPDIISRLSDTELGIEEKRYRTIIGHILNLVQKDKQLETLVEKLCHRFQATVTTRQWRDISYCLSLFTYNEKSIRKLTENFSCYADKLYEPEVYEFFLGILASARKLVKPEVKVLIEELEGRMQESHEKGVEDENVLNKAANAKTKAKKVRSSVSKGRIREAEDTRSQLHPAHRQNKENQRTTRLSGNLEKPRKKKVTISTDSDEDNSKVLTPPQRKSGRMSHVKPLSENSARLSRSSRRK
ncbi:hypothetical protein C7M84_018678 [Penaeus vannamei]|uniref:Condensin complex subunit 1 n=1 Tax=Penaeus vannamei TaxID=6689 RepID=A0A423SGX8_PENVA|nr:hypothetical protein C7M84_018678 [Penaeus vannamei]